MLKKIATYLCFAILLLSLDAVVKYYVFKNIPLIDWLYPTYPYGGIGIFKIGPISFSISHIENTGAAWGILQQYPQIIVYLRIAIVVFLIGYLIFDHGLKFPLVMIVAGALGNILDFLLYGKVIDMFYLKFGSYSYPIFNLADSYITIGIVILILHYAINRWKKKYAH